MRRQKATQKGSRVPFEQVHANVDLLMEIFHKAAQKNPDRNDTLHLLYKFSTVEYLRRTGWDLDDFANACDRLSAGHIVPNDAPNLEIAIS